MDNPAAAGPAPAEYRLTPTTVAQLTRVAAAASRARSGPASLTGVLLDGHLVAATDDRRLATATVPDELPSLVLPARALTRAIRGAPAGLTLAVTDQTARLRATGTDCSWTLTYRPAAGYPNLAALLRRLHGDEILDVNVAALREAIAPWTGKGQPLVLHPAAGKLHVAAADGTPLAELAAQSTARTPLAVDPALLLDLLKVVTTATVQLQVSRRPPPGAILVREERFAYALLCLKHTATGAAA